MTRSTVFAWGAALGGLAGLAAIGSMGMAPVMPSYLAAWLVLFAVPAGALPLVLGLDALGVRSAPILPVLRRSLMLMPLAAALALPILLDAGGLHPAPSRGGPEGGLLASWVSPPAILIRSVLVLGLWTGLALVFARPASPGAARGRLAIIGLLLHALLGTVASNDFVLAAEPTFSSSAFGLLVMAAQVGLALALAVVVAPPRDGRSAASIGVCLAIALAFWGFLVFTQFLVVWSANLPREAAWYLRRSAGLGQAAEYAAGVVCLLAFVVLLAGGRRRLPVMAAAGALVALHGIEMFWLVTPAYRAWFGFTPSDALALCGLGGLGWVLARFPNASDTHGGFDMTGPERKRASPVLLGGILIALGALLAGVARKSRAPTKPSPGPSWRPPSAKPAGTRPPPRPDGEAQRASEVDPTSRRLGYEVRDTRAGTLALVMAAAVVIIVGSIAGLFVMVGRFRASDQRAPPLTAQQTAVIVPPGPHLQDHPLADIAAQRERETDLLTTYAWADAAHTRARIPIERAIVLVTGKPLDPVP